VASDKPDSFQCGAFEVAKNPNVSQFVEKLNRLREAVDQCRLQPGVGYTLNRSSGGTSLTISTGQGGVVAPDIHPFKIFARMKDNKMQAKIQKESELYDPVKKDITGLDEWNNIGNSEICQIYLEAKISDHKIQSAKIDFSGSSKSLVDPSDGQSAQTATRIPLGSITKKGVITQSVKTHLRTNLGCLNGFAYLLITPL
jgi:hypothetical protein